MLSRENYESDGAAENPEAGMSEPSETASGSDIEDAEFLDESFDPPDAGIAGFEEDRDATDTHNVMSDYGDLPTVVSGIEADNLTEIEVRSISSPSYHRRGERASTMLQSSLVVIQHADTALSSIELLFAPLTSALASPTTFPGSPSGLFSQVAVLNVQGNLLRDLSPLLILSSSLRMLNAAENQISSLPPRSFWSQFARLELCFLAQNSLGTWISGDDWLEALGGAGRLRWLTLAGNPIMSRSRARVAIVNKLPNLCALDDFVVADHERVLFARATRRYTIGDDARLRLRLGDHLLIIPRVFRDDFDALQFVEMACRKVVQHHAKNSACITIQRAVRGFLSRNYQRQRGRMAAVWTMRMLITRVQAAARGFLFRRRIQKDFEALVIAQGNQAFLDTDPSVSLRVPLSARRALQRLRVLVQRWRKQLHDKRHAIAVTKIRVWCRMVRQRHRRRAEQLVHQRQELIIYYDDNEHGDGKKRVLALAAWAARRDPFLMRLAREERERLLQSRCSVSSGVRVLRHGSLLENLSRDHRDHLNHGDYRGDALVRIFRSDMDREARLLVHQKKMLLGDLERVRLVIKSAQCGQMTSDFAPLLPREVNVYLMQMERELETRLAVCSKKILSTCVKTHERQARTIERRFSLAQRATRLRPRGFSLSPWERRKTSAIHQTKGADTDQYRTLQTFIPWSIDMHLLVLAGLTNTFPVHVAQASHDKRPNLVALSYEQVRRLTAAISIQCAWRSSRVYLKRLMLEVMVTRATVCLQRWWRSHMGIRRRLAFMRACVAVGASVNSHTLYMEAHVYHALQDRSRWEKMQSTMRSRQPEQALPIHLGNKGRVVVAVSSPQLLLVRSASQEGVSLAQLLVSSSSMPFKTASTLATAMGSQRCNSVLPAWLPGVPEHEEATMSSRSSEDVIPILLNDGVEAESTLLERELMLCGASSSLGGSLIDTCELFAQTNPFRCMTMGHRIAEAASQLMNLARTVTSSSSDRSPRHHHPSGINAASLLALESTSLVRLQFESVDEARRRSIALLAKTFDYYSGTFVQLHSIEALVGAALRHHQWALSQLPNAVEAITTLDNSQRWLNARVPSPWWIVARRKLVRIGLSPELIAELSSIPVPAPPIARFSGSSHGRRVPGPTLPDAPTGVSCYRDKRGRRIAAGAALSAQPTDLVVAEPSSPVRIVVSVTALGSSPGSAYSPRELKSFDQPHPPNSTASPSHCAPSNDSGSSRHQLLTNRLGQSKIYESIAALKREQHEQRMYQVRDLREERERAMEALIVDRRMQQRECAAEVAGVKLDIDVKLVKLKYERELERIAIREQIESEKVAATRTKLTHKFEKQFASQSGALMRRAARDAVERARQVEHDAQKQLAQEVRAREAQEIDRRQDAKSWWFVNNQQARRERGSQKRAEAIDAANAERMRLTNLRQRIREDKEIKNLLKIV